MYILIILKVCLVTPVNGYPRNRAVDAQNHVETLKMRVFFTHACVHAAACAASSLDILILPWYIIIIILHYSN